MKIYPLKSGVLRYFGLPPKILLIMKMIVVMLTTCLMQVSAATFAQKLTLIKKRASLEQIFAEIKKQTGYFVVYAENKVDKNTRMDVDFYNTDLRDVLDVVSKSQNLDYSFDEKNISLKSKAPTFLDRLAERWVAIDVRGRVLDKQGAPLPNASIRVKGKSFVTNTNQKGEFSIANVADGAVLVISYVGYKPLEINLKDAKMPLEIKLDMATGELQEVDITYNTGYQTISKERAGGAITVIDQDMLKNKAVLSISNALEGLVAGMAGYSSRGQDRFLIRGEGTLQGAQDEKDPLIVVDGFPIRGFANFQNEGGDGLLNSKDPFASINPNDVETITVLKDAAAASIYGARAANGVIVITTKKGRKSEKINISASGYMSVDNKPDLAYRYNMASTESTFSFLEHLKKYDPDYYKPSYNAYLTPKNPFSFLNEPAQLMKEYELGKITENQFNSMKSELLSRDQTLWENDLNRYVFRNAIHKQYNIAMRGGSEKMTYSLSTAFDTDKAYEQGNETKRWLINFQNNFKLHKKLSLDIGANVNVTNALNNAVGVSGIAPWWRLVDNNGRFVHSPVPGLSGNTTMYYPILMNQYEDKLPVSWQYNPVVDRDYMDNTSKKMGARLNASLTYNVIKELSLSLKGQYEYSRYSARKVYEPGSYYVRNLMNTYSQMNASTGRYESYFPIGGILTDNGDTYGGYDLRAQATFNKKFGKQDLSAFVGTEIISSTTERDPSITRYGYNDKTNAVISTIDYITQKPDIFGTMSRIPYDGLGGLTTIENRFFSGYTNATYTYDGRYSLYGSIRTDASNFQARDVRDKFSPFWSASAVWILSKEKFMKQVDWLSFLKLRFSAGESGIAAGKSGTSMVTTVSVAPGSLIYNNNEAVNRIAFRGNPTLTWEKSRNYDIGVEFGLWQGKLTGDLTFYDRYSYDVLAPASVPLILQGVSSATFNNAAISNKGIELTLGSKLNIIKDLNWRGNLTFSYNKNKLLEYRVLNSSGTPEYLVGFPLQPIWARDITGYTSDGLMVLRGKDGSEVIIKSRDDTHIYDRINEAAGDKVEDYNWAYYIGTRTPKMNFGFTNNFSYKGFDLSFLITGKFDYYFSKDFSYGSRLSDASYSKNIETAIKIHEEGYGKQPKFVTLPLWTEGNKDVFEVAAWSVYMSQAASNVKSSYYRADQLRLQEIHLGYTIPDDLLGRRAAFHGINIFAQAKNLGLIWTANGKWDPSYPPGTFKPAKTFVVGLKFNLN